MGDTALLRDEIVLLGPPFAGKSTLGRLLATRLGVGQASLDDLRWDYYREIGYDEALAAELRQKGGFLALAPFRFAVRLLPAADAAAAIAILQQRSSHLVGIHAQGFNWAAYFVTHALNQRRGATSSTRGINRRRHAATRFWR